MERSIPSPEEQAARQVIEAGRKFGYGNMIAYLQTAWAKFLMDEYGFDEATARRAAGGAHSGYPFDFLPK